jgi:hypothetical protein
MDDMVAKGRSSFGEHHGILTEDQVLQIHEMAWDGVYTQLEIGDMFGVSDRNVSSIKYQRWWKHLWHRPPWTTPVIEEVTTP